MAATRAGTPVQPWDLLLPRLSLAARPVPLLFPLPSPPPDPGGGALLALRPRPLFASLPPSLLRACPLLGPFPSLAFQSARLVC